MTEENNNGGSSSPSSFLLEDDFADQQKHERKLKMRRWILIGVGCLIGITILAVLLGVLIPRHKDKDYRPLNVVIMIGDGFGPAAASMARLAQARMKKLDSLSLHLDSYLVGTVRTASYNSDVTDSAAGGTAYATGVHCNNEAISVDHEYKAVGTLLEAGRLKSMRVGVFSTNRITDATPACFYSHASNRHQESFIAEQMIAMNLDVALGGGAQFFNQSLRDKAAANQIAQVGDRAAMLNVTSGKIMGLFTPHDMPYEIDRINQKMTQIPTLSEMAAKALELLSRDNEHGFIVMVEGAKIDMAGHSNDAATQIYETIAFDEAFNTVIEFANRDKNTIVLVTADHETGGLTLGFQSNPHVYPDYKWLPEMLLQFTASAQTMEQEIFAAKVTDATAATNISIINSVVNKYYTPGNWDQSPNNFSTPELELLQSFWSANQNTSFASFLGRFLSQRALVGFTTNGHTGVDVNLYTHYSGTDDDVQELLVNRLNANVENIDLAHFVAKVLELDLDEVTASLANFNPGPVPAAS